MTTVLHTGFFGVFSPKGELEAVESTEGVAHDSALNLSPQVNGKPPSTANRTVKPVTVIDGDLATAFSHLNQADLDTMAERARQRIQAKIAAEIEAESQAILVDLKAKGVVT